MNELAIFLTQLSFGIALFFITNWIGKHSYSVGYMEISIFVKSETAPAFNFLFRVLSPVVYIIIISTILYTVGLDEFVNNIYLVSIYYIAFRIFFNVVTNRARLLNWRRQFLHTISIIAISWLAYDSIIKNKRNILPDLSTISNELWIIILLFLFQTLNNLKFSSDDTEKRKENYLNVRFNKFKRIYDTQINNLTNNKKIQALIYSIMIYEDFNRPKAARIIENIKFRFSKRPMTLGVMQIRSDELINDFESVTRGVIKVLNDLKEIKESKEIQYESDFRDHAILPRLIEKFNGGQSYNDEVAHLFWIIWRKYYNGDYSAVSFED